MIKSQAFEAPKIQEILKIEEAPKSLEKSAEIIPKIMTPISKKSSEVSDLERDDESSPSEESLGSIHDLKSGIPRINLNSKESLWTKSQRDTEGSRPRTMGTGGISITEKMKTLPKNSALFRIFERNYADDKEQSLTWKNLELKSQNKETFNAYYKKLQKEQEKHKEWERTLPVQERLKRRNNKKLELLKVHSHKNSVADQMSWQKKRDGLHTTKNCSFVNLRIPKFKKG
ncbi:unnamed protein product [Moneuplotes crassus]|uniref:Uncharacterized protein n=1 Tax=Euplotes crassus TaxID=5936 RepID=A0AAD1X7W2_EUPCR|nr:unnamed protein product [Moneuplotes crassus]